ncbi:MAG: radical SAM protein [Bdellovibrionales bacterium]|nr:radical SAM protein [Bdellovibrionales bacterium]
MDTPIDQANSKDTAASIEVEVSQPPVFKENGNKTLIMVGRDGQGRAFSAEELLAKKLNSWQGWYCAAGIENIYISHDGCVFSAVCREGGYFGNVFDYFLYVPENFIKCPKKWCMCGTDMALRKFKSQDDIHWAYTDPQSEAAENFQDFVASQPLLQSRVLPKQITWELGRRCNFSCRYCPPTASNNYESHRSWGSLKHAVDNIFKAFVKERSGKFHFSGGEPTFNPSFMDLCKYIRERRPISQPDRFHYCHVTTNGSRQPQYYEELIEYCQISVSVHFEFYNEEKLLETIAAVVARKSSDASLIWQWFGVRIMVPPGTAEKAQHLMEKIYAIPNFREQSQLNLSPIYKFKEPEGWDESLADYHPEELSFIGSHG